MPQKKWFSNDITDGFLRRLYDPTVRGRSQEIAARLKVPRWAVNRRAAALGLSRPKDRPWSAKDEAYLEANFHHISVKALARRFGRSTTAIRLKGKRLGLREYDECYTGCSLWLARGAPRGVENLRHRAFGARSLAGIELLSPCSDAASPPTRPSGAKEGVL